MLVLRCLAAHFNEDGYVVLGPDGPTYFSQTRYDLDIFILKDIDLPRMHTLTELTSDHNPILLDLDHV